jgi:hypothetical protein
MTTIDAKYQIVNGTYYHARTPAEVVRVLEQARLAHTRIRIHLGDVQTGRDWLDEWDVTGIVGRSMGPIRIPLMIATIRSSGGPGILDHCIVRIRTNSRDLYRHPSYHHGEIVVKPETFIPPSSSSGKRTYSAATYVNGQIHARFESMEQAERWVSKMGLVIGANS